MLTYHSHLVGHLDSFQCERFTHVKTFVRFGYLAQGENGGIGDRGLIDGLNLLLDTVTCLARSQRLGVEK